MTTKTKKEQKNSNNGNKSVPEIFEINKNAEESIETLKLDDEMDEVLEKWTFRKIIRGIKRGKIIVDHDFQRDEVYRTPQKSGIINSVLRGKIIPPLYAFEDKVDGKYVLSIIDGQQRLSSVRDFMNSKYELMIPFGKMSILNGYTFEQIKNINPELAEEIGDKTLTIAVLRNITKKEAQEYFGLINTTSMPLSPGEKLWSIVEPVGPLLEEIVENPYFKISNLRKSRKGEYVVATKLLWNQMFNDPLKHEFVGNRIKEFTDYFNTTDEIELLFNSQEKVLELLRIYSEIVENCQYSPRSQSDLYAALCFVSVMRAYNNVNIPLLSKFFNWVFRGINKQIYPLTVKEDFESIMVTRSRPNAKNFVILLEKLYKHEVKLWQK